MSDFDPVLEQKLADLSDVDWQALTARVRPPTSTQQLKEIAGRVIDGDKLDAFVKVANLKAFADENGDINEERVMGALTGMFGVVPDGGPQHHDFGQNRPRPPQPGPGERGAAEAARRFGGQQANTPSTGRGAGGAAEAAKRFGPKEQR
jgi:hypothetical protein